MANKLGLVSFDEFNNAQSEFSGVDTSGNQGTVSFGEFTAKTVPYDDYVEQQEEQQKSELEVAAPEKSFLDTVVGAIELPGSMAREALLQAFHPSVKPDIQKFKDIWGKKKTRTASEFLEELGWKDPGFLASLATDIITDPINLIPFAGTAMKAGGIAKNIGLASAKKLAGAQLAKTAAEASAGVAKYSGAKLLQELTAKSALAASKIPGAKGALVGTTAGLASYEDGDDAVDVMKKALVGAGLGAIGQYGLKGAGALTKKGLTALSSTDSGKGVKNILENITGRISKTTNPMIEAVGNSISSSWDKIGGTKLADNLTDWYYTYTRPEVMKLQAEMVEAGGKALRPSEAFKVAQQFETETLPFQWNHMLKTKGILEEASTTLGEQGFKQFDDIMDSGLRDFTEKRNEMRTLWESENYQIVDGKREWIGAGDEKTTRALFEKDATIQANQLAKESVAKLVEESGNPNISKYVDDYVKHNQEMIGEMNTIRAQKALGKDATEEQIQNYIAEKGMVQIDHYHPQRFVPKEHNINEVYLKSTGFGKRHSEFVKDMSEYTIDERAVIGGQRYVKGFETQLDGNARQLVDTINNTSASGSWAKTLESVIDKYDGFTNGLKTLHLNASHMWLLNNYIDSTTKAYAKHGVGEALSALKELGPHKILQNDSSLGKIFEMANKNHGQFIRSLDDKYLDLANAFGVINPGMMQELATQKMSHAQRILKFGREKAEEIAADLAELSFIKRPINATLDTLQNTVGRYGSAMEATIRGMDFKRNLANIAELNPALKTALDGSAENLLKAARTNPSVRDAVWKAKQITDDTFIDYGKVSLGEQKILKRIFPYYTFFARNLPFWMEQAATNPRRFMNVAKIQTSRGRKPSDKERGIMPDYMLDSATRVLGKDSNGGLKVGTQTGMALLEAGNLLNMILSPSTGKISGEGLSRINPILKTTIEQFTDKDLFMGGDLTPKGTAAGGYGRKAIGAGTLANLLRSTGSVEKTDQGGLVVTNPVAARLLNLQSSLLPIPAADTVARSLNALIDKGESVSNVIQNLSGTKQKTISRKAQAYTAAKRLKEYREEIKPAEQKEFEQMKRDRKAELKKLLGKNKMRKDLRQADLMAEEIRSGI